MILARLTSSSDVGSFALGVAVASSVTAFTNLQLRAIQATDARDKNTFGEYLALRLAMSAVTLVIVAAVVLVNDYSATTRVVIVVIGVGRAFDMVGDVLNGYLQRQERMDLIAKVFILNGILSVILVVVLSAATRDVVWAAVGNTVASMLTLFGFNLRAVSRVRADADATFTLRPEWRAGRLARLAWRATPLGIVMLVLALSATVPRYVIERDLGLPELGVFAALAYPSLIGFTLVNALGQSLSSRLGRELAAGRIDTFRMLMRRSLGIAAAIGILGTIGAVVAGRVVLRIFYGPGYSEHAGTFVILMVASGVSYIGVFGGYALVALRRFWAPLVANLGSLIVVVVSSLILVGQRGLEGAALAVLGGAITGSVLVLTTVALALKGEDVSGALRAAA